MGQPKALLPLGGRTFLECVVGALRDGGCAAVWVVAGDPADPVAAAVASGAERLGAMVAVNHSPGSEQIDSLRAGLRALPADARAAVVLPVDVPGATAALVRAVIEAHLRTGRPIALPVRDGHHGHPVLFARELWPALLEGDLPEGARTVVHASAGRLAEVPVEALPADVDTPADYRRLEEGGS
jgi:molybdenum cofactor cytidylyltransferase